MRLALHNPTSEQAALYNPALIAWTLWHAVDQYQETSGGHGLPVSYAFLHTPLVLDSALRAALPGSSRTPMAEWTGSNGDVIARLHQSLPSFAPFTRRGLLLAATGGLVTVDGSSFEIVASRRARGLDSESADMADMRKKARLVGRWLAAAGSQESVLSFWGLRP